MNNINWNLLNEIQKAKITPDMAKFFLSKNNSNRNISKLTLDLYSREMINGTWEKNSPNVLVFSSDGHLLDGQHRLYAVINSNKTFEWNVFVHNKNSLEISPMDLMVDIGKKRTISDLTGMNSWIVSPIRLLLSITKNNNRYVSTSEVLNFYKCFLEQDENFTDLLKRKKAPAWATTETKLVAIAFYISNEENREYVINLINSILTNNIEEHPILLKYILRCSRSPPDRHTRIRLAITLFDKKNKDLKVMNSYLKPLSPFFRELLMEAGLEEGFWRTEV